MLAVHFWGMRYEVSTPFVHSAIPPEELDKHPHQWEKPANLCRRQDFSTSLHKGQRGSRREARLPFAPALPPWSEPNWLCENRLWLCQELLCCNTQELRSNCPDFSLLWWETIGPETWAGILERCFQKLPISPPSPFGSHLCQDDKLSKHLRCSKQE